MAHFGSGNWVGNYGPIPYSTTVSGFSKSAFVTPTTTATGSTEGTDKATFTAPDAGMYRVTVYLANSVVSDAATTDVIEPVVTYTDAVGAKSAVNVAMGSTQLTVNHKTSGEARGWVGIIRALAAGSIVIAIKDTVTGAKTVGQVNWSAVVEKIGE